MIVPLCPSAIKGLINSGSLISALPDTPDMGMPRMLFTNTNRTPFYAGCISRNNYLCVYVKYLTGNKFRVDTRR